MMAHTCTRKPQSGAVAVEFALVFPILFLLVYAVVVYAYTFVLQESINFAAQEAAEAAVAVDPSAPDADALRASRVRQSAVAVLDWLPVAQKQRVIGSAGELVDVRHCAKGSDPLCPVDTDGIIITLRFNMITPGYLFPVLDLPFLGPVPPLPKQLTAQAVARV